MVHVDVIPKQAKQAKEVEAMYIPLTGEKGQGKFITCDKEDFEMLNQYEWVLRDDGYAWSSEPINGQYCTVQQLVMNNMMADRRRSR